MKTKLLGLIAGLALFTVSQAGASTITYAVFFFGSQTNGALAVGGSITTDGTLGTITNANIVDWNLVGVTAPSLGSPGGFFDLTSANSFVSGSVTATPSTLEADTPAEGLDFHTAQNSEYIQFNQFGSEELQVIVTDSSFSEWPSSFISLNTNVVAGGQSPSLVGAPGPVAGAGLPGIVLAVGVVGLLGWRRKRHGAATAA